MREIGTGLGSLGLGEVRPRRAFQAWSAQISVLVRLWRNAQALVGIGTRFDISARAYGFKTLEKYRNYRKDNAPSRAWVRADRPRETVREVAMLPLSSQADGGKGKTKAGCAWDKNCSLSDGRHPGDRKLRGRDLHGGGVTCGCRPSYRGSGACLGDC